MTNEQQPLNDEKAACGKSPSTGGLGVFARLKRWWRERKVLNECGCICYCPRCKDVLNDQAACGETTRGTVFYFCNSCGCLSEWSFDIAPCPLLLTHNVAVSSGALADDETEDGRSPSA